MKADHIRSAEDSITEAAVRSSAAKHIPVGSILMVTRSGILSHTFPVAINDCEVTVNQDLKTLSPADGVDPRYVAWFLRSNNHRILSGCAKHGTTVASIDTERLKALTVQLAPAGEQQRIVEKIETLLAELDKGEETLREVQKLLARYRQSVLKAAVNGDLTADWRAANGPPQETGDELLGRILKQRRETWQGRGKYNEPVEPNVRGLPDLPDGWVWASIDQVTIVFRNGLSKKPQTAPNEFPILRISAVRPMVVSFDDLRYYSPDENERIDDCWASQGDLLFTRYNGSAHLVGVCGLVRTARRALHPDKLIRATPVSISSLSTDFLELSWNAGATRRHIEANTKTTSGQQGIAGGDIKAAPFALPPADEQEVIAELVSDALARIGQVTSWCEAELKRSAALRQSILKDAFSGKLVPQDSSDEPAEKLLERIRAARSHNTKQTRKKVSA